MNLSQLAVIRSKNLLKLLLSAVTGEGSVAELRMQEEKVSAVSSSDVVVGVTLHDLWQANDTAVTHSHG